MIIENGTKSKVVYKDGVRVYAIFIGTDLVYNCYAIPEHKVVIFSSDSYLMEDNNVASNTKWNIT